MNFINKLQRFMYGRYGIDDLYKFLFKVYIILLIINIFIHHYILFILETILIIIIFYRIFSKKIYKRNKENQIYLKMRNKIVQPFKNIKKKYHDKNHIYKKCHHCNVILKLPLPESRGIKHTRCPKCKKRLTIITLKKQKIEIITNR